MSCGLPTVQYCADRLCLSSNYFSDLIKRTTNDTASNYIRRYMIQQAKNELAKGMEIAQVAYGFGFEYAQHFSRMFKKQTGMTTHSVLQKSSKIEILRIPQPLLGTKTNPPANNVHGRV